MLDPLESVIEEAMSNGNDVQPSEIANAIRESPNVAVSILADKSDRSTEMTRFGVHLQVDVSTEDMDYVGSPMDWNWDGIVSKMVGDEARTNVEVRSVVIESTVTVDEDLNVIEETTYTVSDRMVKLSSDVVTLPKEVVTDTLTAFSEGVAWNDEQRSSYTKLADTVGVQAPIEGDEHYDG